MADNKHEIPVEGGGAAGGGGDEIHSEDEVKDKAGGDGDEIHSEGEVKDKAGGDGDEIHSEGEGGEKAGGDGDDGGTSISDVKATIAASNPSTSAIGETDTKNAVNPSIGGSGDGTDAGTGSRDAPGLQFLTPIGTIPQGNEVIRSLAVVGSKHILLTGSDTQTVRVWQKGQHHSYFQSSTGPINAIAILEFNNPPDYAWRRSYTVFLAHKRGVSVFKRFPRENVFTPCGDLQKLLDVFKISLPFSGEARDKAVTCLCFSDNLRYIYSGSMDGTVNMWDVERTYNGLVDTFRGDYGGAIHALAVGEEVIFSGSSGGIINMWKRGICTTQRDEGKLRHLLIRTLHIANGTVPAAVNAIVFCTINDVTGLLYAGSSDGNVRCWRTSSLDEAGAFKDNPEVLSYHKRAVNCLALCSGPFVFSGSADTQICVWRMDNEGKNHTPVMVMKGHSDIITCITVEEDREVSSGTEPRQWILYSGSLDKTLRICRVYDDLQSTARVSILPKFPHQTTPKPVVEDHLDEGEQPF